LAMLPWGLGTDRDGGHILLRSCQGPKRMEGAAGSVRRRGLSDGGPGRNRVPTSNSAQLSKGTNPGPAAAAGQDPSFLSNQPPPMPHRERKKKGCEASGSSEFYRDSRPNTVRYRARRREKTLGESGGRCGRGLAPQETLLGRPLGRAATRRCPPCPIAESRLF
jgi:hypothetical protein